MSTNDAMRFKTSKVRKDIKNSFEQVREQSFNGVVNTLNERDCLLREKVLNTPNQITRFF